MESALPLDERSQRLAEGTAIVVGAIALLVLAGWATGAVFLIRIVPSYPPLRASMAVGLAGVALALHGFATARTRFIAVGSGLALLVGTAFLAEYALGGRTSIDSVLFEVAPGLDVFGGAAARMSVMAALNLVLCGSGMLLLLTPNGHRAASAAAGAVGGTVAAFCLTMLLAYGVDVLSSLRESVLSGLAIHAAVACAATGLTILAIAWRRDPGESRLPDWAPLAVCVSALITTLALWRSLALQEQQRFASLLDDRVAVAQHELVATLQGGMQMLRRLDASALIKLSGDPVPVGPDAPPPLGDIPGTAAIGWLDASQSLVALLDTRAERPPDIGELRGIIAGSGFRPEAIKHPLMRVATSTRGPYLVLSVPDCDPMGCHGVATAVLEPDLLLRPALGAALPGYGMAVRSAGVEILRTPDSTGVRSPEPGRAAVTMLGIPWQVEVWPTRATASLFSSDLAEVVLGMGLVVAALLTVSSHLVYKSVDVARLAERDRLAVAFESATDGLWELDVTTGESTRSASVWQRLGYDPSQWSPQESAQRWAALIHPVDAARVASELAQYLNGEKHAFEIEYWIRSSSNEWHAIVERGRVVSRDAWGRPARVLGICADVTERRRADMALAESERRFRVVFDSGFQFQALLDREGALIEANRTSLDFAGTTLEAVRGRSFWDTPWWSGNAKREQRLRAACAEAAEGKTVLYQEEVQGAGDERAIIEFSLKPIHNGGGPVTQILAEGRNITDRKRAEDALREMETLSTMGKVAARVAHEINNPLAGIQNSFLLIKDAVPVTHPHFAYVGAIEREIARIAAATRQLYETFRPQNDETAEASVSLVVSDAVRMLEQVNKDSQVRIEVHTPGTLVLPISSALLRQAVYNLVQNAVDASPPGGTVTVRAWRDPDNFWMAVRDKGRGVPLELRERIFEPFVSTKSELTTGGMGLGLSLVKRSVQAMGGRIEIHDPEGGGAEFRIRLPLAGQSSRATA